MLLLFSSTAAAAAAAASHADYAVATAPMLKAKLTKQEAKQS
jgi:hypothetical protein